MTDLAADPMPDMPDSPLWDALLHVAAKHPDAKGEPFWSLIALRVRGAELQWDGKLVRLAAGDMPEADYQQFRTDYLLPHKHMLQQALKETAQVLRSREREAAVEADAPRQRGAERMYR